MNGSQEKPGDWEAICSRCGQCCFEKWVDSFGRIRHTAIPCRFLDIVTRECKVYHKRFDVGEGCIQLTPELVRSVRWLPEDCAYVKYVRKTCPGSRVGSPESKVRGPKSKSRRSKSRDSERGTRDPGL